MWYYHDGESSIGPLGLTGLQALHRVGEIGDDTWVLGPDYDDWVPFSSVPELVAPPQPQQTADPPDPPAPDPIPAQTPPTPGDVPPEPEPVDVATEPMVEVPAGSETIGSEPEPESLPEELADPGLAGVAPVDAEPAWAAADPTAEAEPAPHPSEPPILEDEGPRAREVAGWQRYVGVALGLGVLVVAAVALEIWAGGFESRGMSLYEQGEMSAAVEPLRKAVTHSLLGAGRARAALATAEVLSRARDARERGDLHGALGAFREALALDLPPALRELTEGELWDTRIAEWLARGNPDYMMDGIRELVELEEDDGLEPSRLEQVRETLSTMDRSLAGKAGTVLTPAVEEVCEGQLPDPRIFGRRAKLPWSTWGRSVLPLDFVAESPGELGFAVCVTKTRRDRVETCSYTPSGSVTRYRANWQVELRRVDDAEVVASRTLSSNPDRCPATFTFMGGSRTGSIEGKVPSSAIASWLRGRTRLFTKPADEDSGDEG